MTLDDLARQNATLAEIRKFYSTHQKKMKEVRPILSVAKYGPMILVSRNIRYLRIFAGVPREVASIVRRQ